MKDLKILKNLMLFQSRRLKLLWNAKIHAKIPRIRRKRIPTIGPMVTTMVVEVMAMAIVVLVVAVVVVKVTAEVEVVEAVAITTATTMVEARLKQVIHAPYLLTQVIPGVNAIKTLLTPTFVAVVAVVVVAVAVTTIATTTVVVTVAMLM